ncbi:elongator complex protein 4 isoform X2 [Belonocnema kinseyi]|uniref:elongator complex protein 4 isoform X2 n=1 Tax=Belonocnema kinseyi TaxID=2817044 RepID=UPI00143D10D6|nr:elongator complex protein 4 isoform X2 [Belonocnema kinseyi]
MTVNKLYVQSEQSALLMASGFVKGKKLPLIPGTKPSTHNAQLLVSTGIPSLDHVIGGGLPIGSILLIEDTYGNYANIMLKYFIAEGILVSHNSFIASRDTKPAQFLSEIPAVANDSSTGNKTETNEEMQIAWRYQNLKLVDSSPSGSQVFGHYFDLTKTMDKEKIDRTQVTEWDGENILCRTNAFEKQEFVDLLKSVEETLSKGQFLVSDSPEKRNILRIALRSLGSRLWMCDKEEDTKNDLLRFFYCFRALLRNSYAVATITFPVQFYHNEDALVHRLEHLADTVVGLESFAGSDKEANPVFKDYHGLMHIKKVSAFNTLAPHCPHSMDLAFKLRRKKFLIEVLHMPPELGDTAQREQDDVACGSGSTRSSVLEF